MDNISINEENSVSRPKKTGFGKKLRKQWQLVLMSVPMICYVLLFNYGPMWGWITAFQDYKPKMGISGSKFVGWKNFIWLFGRRDFLESIRNTLGMSVINLVFGTVSAILLEMRQTVSELHLNERDREVVTERMERQLQNAREWRDVINTFFHRLSGVSDAQGRRIYD